MKNYIVAIIIAIVVSIALTAAGVYSYSKKTQKQLESVYTAEIAKTNKTLSNLQAENELLKAQITSDKNYIDKKDVELSKLKNQTANLKNELAQTKIQIKEFTAGESIKYFEDYTQTTDNKMLVQNIDTSLIITIPTIKTVDTIFAEHKNLKLEAANLHNITQNQDGIIVIQTNTINLYKSLVNNKDLELSSQKDLFTNEKNVLKAESYKFKTQRNRARTIIGTTVGVVVGYFILKK